MLLCPSALRTTTAWRSLGTTATVISGRLGTLSVSSDAVLSLLKGVSVSAWHRVSVRVSSAAERGTCRCYWRGQSLFEHVNVFLFVGFKNTEVDRGISLPRQPSPERSLVRQALGHISNAITFPLHGSLIIGAPHVCFSVYLDAWLLFDSLKMLEWLNSKWTRILFYKCSSSVAAEMR